MVAVRGNEDLRLMPKAPEADGMNDAIAVALKCVAGTARAPARLSMLTAAALFRQAGVGRMRAHFSVRFSTSSPSVLSIGRASCRGRVCQYVLLSVVAVSLKKK